MKTLNSMWIEAKDALIPDGAPDKVVEAQQGAFFLGASSTMELINRAIATATDIPDFGARLKLIEAEIDAYTAVKRRELNDDPLTELIVEHSGTMQ